MVRNMLVRPLAQWPIRRKKWPAERMQLCCWLVARRYLKQPGTLLQARVAGAGHWLHPQAHLALGPTQMVRKMIVRPLAQWPIR